MLLYHGSYLEIKHPDILHSRKNVDFGRGFYTTPLLEQATKWCEKYKDKKLASVLSIYRFDETAYNTCKVLKFDTYSEQWLDFILQCRKGNDTSDYDVVMGGVANDRVFNTVELYYDGLIAKEEAIKRLRFEKPNYQIAFRTQHVIDEYLHFERSEPL
ncbi:MAG: DUF3990 domain-containing protein [Lachnospiraceae bacterium]|nr:DUF3990 domain-containing protein [Lachnospiraceae bacterium]